MSSRKLKILADENIPGPVCSWLRGLKRVDLVTAKDAQLCHQEDANIVAYARENGRIVLAGDRGFSELNYKVCTHPGIINVSDLNTKPFSCLKKLRHVIWKGRRFVGHNVIHVRENDFCVVKVKNEKEIVRYR